jgi:hypothetical protein
VKPNAGLPDLLMMVKSDLNKLSRSDAVVVIGGSNDIGKIELNTNLTSIVTFLDVLQHTNVIIAELPVRYDIGATPWINGQIKQYNKKLGIVKGHKQAKLIRITTDREHYTKHGLHLNSRGKESMVREILTYLQGKQVTHAISVIHLPWKNNTVEVVHEGNLNDLLNEDTDMEECKASSSKVDDCSIINRT